MPSRLTLQSTCLATFRTWKAVGPIVINCTNSSFLCKKNCLPCEGLVQTPFKPIIMTEMKKKIQISFWFFIALAILLAVFSVQNAGIIEVQVLWFPVNVSLSILLIGTFITGLVIGALYAYNKFLPKPSKAKNDASEALKEKGKNTKKSPSNPEHDISPKDF